MKYSFYVIFRDRTVIATNIKAVISRRDCLTHTNKSQKVKLI